MENANSAAGRVIKFRARALTLDKRWVYGSYVTFLNSRGGRVHQIVNYEGVACDVDGNTLCQLTGLHDKNGKEIYERDILRGTGIDGRVRIWEAVSLQYFHHWQETADLIEAHGDVEVIGDVYTTPELLTQ
ncbi:YopX family protein [Rhodopseudomonas palustris]|uniref:YopX family protein n=1 Tax=Rhodopseudomonas palustris TaxID=1076 RepID=UPI000D1A7BAE|nr:hypothetical protein RPYSC3_48190 [Rhodopseudomonas palustris]